MWEAKIKTEKHQYITQIYDQKSFALARIVMLAKRKIEKENDQFPTLLKLAFLELDYHEWSFVSNFREYDRKRRGIVADNKWTKSPKWPKMN